MKNFSPFNLFISVPDDLRKVNRWICHNKNKAPISVKTGQIANAYESSNWATFEDARKYYISNYGDVAGIGFVFSDEDDVIGIDLDHCLDENGNPINEIVKKIIEMNESYIERSFSGTGLHIFTRGILAHPCKIDTEKSLYGFGIEVYKEKRYFTVTGITYPDSFKQGNPVVENQRIIDFVVALGKGQRNNVSKLLDVEVETDEISDELRHKLDTALANPRFSELWNGERPKGNESSDDMALIYRLCQLTSAPEKVKTLFFESGHYSSKDDFHKKKCAREDYLDRSIKAGYAFLSSNISEDYFACAYLLEYDDNDTGNGERFKSMYEGRLIYIEDDKTWLNYNGICWEQLTKSGLNTRAKELQKKYQYLANHFPEKNLVKSAKMLGNNDKRQNMLKAAEDDMAISSSVLNQRNELMAVKNGVISLQTGEFVTALPTYYITIQSPVDYNKDAPEPERFNKFMDEICCGDVDLREYLLRILGYCLTGETKEQVFFIFFGSGANGKSVLVNLMQRLLGSIGTSLAQDVFVAKKEGTSLNPSLVAAKDTRLCFVNEGNGYQRLDAALLKAISGGDGIKVRKLYADHVDLFPHFKIIMTTNQLPGIDLTDEAMRRRMKIIRFDGKFTGKECDPDLPKKLWNEREGILKKLIEYAGKYYEEGLLPYEPDSIADNYDSFQEHCDSVISFITGFIRRVDSPDVYIPTQSVYQAYTQYCKSNDLQIETQRKFADLMRSQGYSACQYTARRTMHYKQIECNFHPQTQVTPEVIA